MSIGTLGKALDTFLFPSLQRTHECRPELTRNSRLPLDDVL